jgi:hypothetical protein
MEFQQAILKALGPWAADDAGFPNAGKGSLHVDHCIAGDPQSGVDPQNAASSF